MTLLIHQHITFIRKSYTQLKIKLLKKVVSGFFALKFKTVNTYRKTMKTNRV